MFFSGVHTYLNKLGLKKTKFCGRRLMGSQIMVSIAQWNQIYPDLQFPNYSTMVPNIG
jgi:hypothetical protein